MNIRYGWQVVFQYLKDHPGCLVNKILEEIKNGYNKTEYYFSGSKG